MVGQNLRNNFGSKDKKGKWKHNLPRVNGQFVVIEANKLTEALDLMWKNEIEPEEIDFYLVAQWN